MNEQILIKNAQLMTMSRSGDIKKQYLDGAVLIEGDEISAVGETDEIDSSADRVIDAEGQIALPGLINGHNHHEQSIMKAITRVFPGTTYEWIHEVKMPLMAEMDAEDYYLSNMLTCLELIKSGVTTSVNHICQQDPDALEAFGIAESIRTIKESGIRSVVPIGFSDQFEREEFLRSPEQFEEMITDAIDRWHHAASDRIRVWPGPPGVFSTSESMWEAAIRVANQSDDIGIYTHLASADWGEVDDIATYGALRDDFVGAHCVWLTEDDVTAMAEAGVSAIHNPTYKLGYTNDNDVEAFGDGIAPMSDLKREGGIVGIGQDGCMGDTQDLFKEMRNFAFTQHYRYRDKNLFPPTTLLEMATIENATALRWDDAIGSLEPGKKADIVLVDLDNIKFDPVLNVPANIVYQATADDVATVVIDGDILMEDRSLTTIDENSIRDQTQRATERLIERADLEHLVDKGVDPWTNELSFAE